MTALHPSEPALRTMLRDAGDIDPEEFLKGFNDAGLRSLLDEWDLWALPHQRMPPGKWRRWIMRGGRGMGKSRGAHSIIHKVARNKKALGDGIIGIVGRTHDDVRLMNICDPATGILATAPSDFRDYLVAHWRPGPGILTWPNGVVARVFSADAPEAIRGNNFAWLLADELQSWPNGEKTWWECVEPAVRVGRAQIMITMTPKPMKWLRDLEAMDRSVRTGATTYDNPFLSVDALASFEVAYAGREIAKQELGGDYIEAVRGALLTYATINGYRVPVPPRDFKQVIIAVDPAVTNTETSDETGIIVYGHSHDDQGYVLADESGKFDIETGEWAEHVVRLYREWGASKVIAEANNGGDHIGGSICAVDRSVPFEKKTATKSKEDRAQPVGMLYKRGRIHHVGNPNMFARLEHELTTWVPGEGKSPNRLDAVVWAATHCHIQDAAPTSVGCIGLLGPRAS